MKTHLLAPLVLILVSGLAIAAPNEHTRRMPGEILVERSALASPQAQARLEAVRQRYGLHLERPITGGVVLWKSLDRTIFGAEERIADALVASGALAFAEPNYLARPAAVPNDPNYGSQWHWPRVKAPAAWDIVTGSKTPLIAICDAGFETDHPDLAANFQLPGFNIVDGTDNLANPVSHGTWVAGTLAAVGNNGARVTGALWRARMLPLQVSNDPEGWATFADMARCIAVAAERGARVVNFSYTELYASAAIESAAVALRRKGGVLVGCAGNDSADLSIWPASPNMLLVGATNSSNQLAGFSNFGGPVDLVAPGALIWTTGAGRSTTIVNGTSFASPIVAGAAALAYSIQPNFLPAEIDAMILSTTTDLGEPGFDSRFGAGLVDLSAVAAEAVRRGGDRLALNLGGGAVQSEAGVIYAPDSARCSGTVATSSVAVGGADPALQPLFQSRREGAVACSAPLTNGTYEVTLLFAEPEVTAAGVRVFDVVAEGQVVLPAVDVFAAAGANTALRRSFRVAVTDGRFELSLAERVGQPILMGLTARVVAQP